MGKGDDVRAADDKGAASLDCFHWARPSDNVDSHGLTQPVSPKSPMSLPASMELSPKSSMSPLPAAICAVHPMEKMSSSISRTCAAARRRPCKGVHDEGGDTAPGLQVRVGRVLQEDAQDGEVAVVRGSHERGVAKAALQVDTRTSFQQHRDDLKVAVA